MSNGGRTGIHSVELLGGNSTDLRLVRDELQKLAPDAHITRFDLSAHRLALFVLSFRGRKLRDIPRDGPDSGTPRVGRSYN